MSQLSIKIQIAGRTYPLTIERSEEEVIRKAAKQIDESVKAFQNNYAVKDKQDLLAMTSLQMLTQSMLKERTAPKAVGSSEELKALDQMLDKVLAAD